MNSAEDTEMQIPKEENKNKEAPPRRSDMIIASAQPVRGRSIISGPQISSSQPNNTQNAPLSGDALQQHERLMEMYERQKTARNIAIPTDEEEIKNRLRQLSQPICLFGEDISDKRERLRTIIMKIYIESGRIAVFKTPQDAKIIHKSQKNTINKSEIFYTPGSTNLREARVEIAKYSLPKSQERIKKAKKIREDMRNTEEQDTYESEMSKLTKYSLVASQYADDRCIARASLSPTHDLLATAGWSGVGRIFGIPDSQIRTEMRGHKDKIFDIAFHPECGVSLPDDGPNVATCSGDTTVRLWSCNPEYEEQKSLVLRGHEDRVNNVAFHPQGALLASSSHDKTWRLWDIERKKELLLQEGHGAPVYPIAFQGDGALFCSGDLNGIGLVWDLRTGRNIMSLQGHVKGLMCLSFLPNAYQIATGSEDNQIRIWDLRRKQCVSTIPAHNKLVSSLRFDTGGNFMASASYDGTAKIWACRDWQAVHVFAKHEDKLTSVNFTPTANYVITTSFDRTFKLWKRGDVAGYAHLENMDNVGNTDNTEENKEEGENLIDMKE